MKWNIAVMFGGGSVEHEVSVISGIQAIMHLDKEKYNVVPVYITKDSEMYAGPDVGNIEAYRDIPGLLKRSQRVFFFREAGEVYLLPYPMKRKTKGTRIDLVLPVVHGKKVEDGTLAGYLRMLGVPFVGCDVGASALGMDKYASKVVLREAGVPVLDGICFNTADYADIDSIVEKTEARLGYPVIVKPVDLGSSVGISVARDRAQLIEAIDDAFTTLWGNDVPVSDVCSIILPPWFYQNFRGCMQGLSTDNPKLLERGVLGKYTNGNVKLSNSLHNDGTYDYAVVMTKRAVAVAGQINEVEAYRPEGLFADAVKGLDTYGAKVVRPEQLYIIKCTKG
jgi:hypothetical protein